MKKYICITVCFLLFMSDLPAQLSIQATVPSVGLIQKSQLWNVLLVNNSSSSYECRLSLILQDRETGQSVLTGTSSLFSVPPGAKQGNATSFGPLEYNYPTSGENSHMSDLLEAGSYIACYNLSPLDTKLNLAQECIDFDVEPLSPPMLTFPRDSSTLNINPTQFSWIPPTPEGMFNFLHYDVIITPINPGQTAEEAVQQNLPLYSNNVMSNVLSYSSATPEFEKEKWYAWQVIARNEKSYAGKSETWVFKIKNPSVIKSIVEQAPFLKLKKNNFETGVAANGILKLSYRNETNDSICHIKISDQSKAGKVVALVTMNLQKGENLIQIDLNKKYKLEEDKMYGAEILNSRGERWMIRFQIKKYKTKESSVN